MLFSLLVFTPFQPTPGLAIWSLVIFVLFWIIVGKYAFKPIAQALIKREAEIQDAMDLAKKTREEMSKIKADNDKLLAEAREERAKMLQEAKEIKNQIINEAKEQAKLEATKLLTNAKHDIDNQKKAAMTEVKNEIGILALSIAEKVIKKDLHSDKDQNALVDTLVKELNLN